MKPRLTPFVGKSSPVQFWWGVLRPGHDALLAGRRRSASGQRSARNRSRRWPASGRATSGCPSPPSSRTPIPNRRAARRPPSVPTPPTSTPSWPSSSCRTSRSAGPPTRVNSSWTSTAARMRLVRRWPAEGPPSNAPGHQRGDAVLRVGSRRSVRLLRSDCPVRQFPVRAWKMTRVPIGVTLEVILMLGLGVPEGASGCDLGEDFAWPQA